MLAVSGKRQAVSERRRNRYDGGRTVCDKLAALVHLAHTPTSMIDYQRLEVWRRAHALTMEVYRLTRAFPTEERFALTVQLRRAATSVPCNVAEGSARSTDRAFASFVEVAEGSAAEAQYQLRLANELGYLEPSTYAVTARELLEIRRMLAKLRARLRRGESQFTEDASAVSRNAVSAALR